MSDYKYADLDGDTLEIHAVPKKNDILVTARSHNVARSVHLSAADVPTVALELLKAAGRADLAECIESAAREATEKAEAEAAEKKLQERRDAVAKEFTKGICYYESVVRDTKTAIDRIIELEDKLASRD